jgi:hypothetical protein
VTFAIGAGDPSTRGPAVGTPRLLSSRTRRTRTAWVITVRLSAAHARSFDATVGGHRVASGSSSRLTVRFRMPYGARRRTLSVTARNGASVARRSWTFRRSTRRVAALRQTRSR